MSAAEFRPGQHLSVAIVARNDEAVLAETIESVRELADEIVVLDAGSADGTAELAASLGARVVTPVWQHDWSAARNHLLARLTGHWVLWLDPGERVDAESAAELRRFVDREANRNLGYQILVELPPASPGASPEEAAMLRLVPNRPQVRFSGRVRESVLPALASAGMKLARAPGRIHRHARCRNADWKSAWAWQQLDLASLEMAAETGPSVAVLLAMGEAASDLNDRAMARQAFGEAVRAASRGSLEMLEGYYGLLSSFDGEQGDAQRQLAMCLEALEIYPLDAQLLCAMGTYLQAQNQLTLAIRAFDTAVKFGRVNSQTWHLVDIDQVAVAYLSLTLQLDGQADRACEVLEQGLVRFPTATRLRRQLVDLHIKHGRVEKAIEAVEALSGEEPQRAMLRDAIRGACHAARQHWTPALAHLQGAYLAGCEDTICLRWLSVVLLSTGQMAAAEPIVRHWLNREPENAEARAYLGAIVRESEPAGSAAPSEEGTTRSEQWHRIDPGMSTLDVISPPIPVITQVSSLGQ
jgi:tetratricopeptide (TPR) repeat protein